MKDILGTISLGFLLRSFIGGVIFYFAQNRFSSIPDLNSSQAAKCLVIGILIYGIHRSVIYPWVELFFNSNWHRSIRPHNRSISKNSTDALLFRWTLNSEKEDNHAKTISHHFTTWADYTHLLYCAAWATILGYIAAEAPYDWFRYWVISTGFLSCAWVSDHRFHCVEDYIRANPTILTSCIVNPSDTRNNTLFN